LASFIFTFAPPPDVAELKKISQSVGKLADPSFGRSLPRQISDVPGLRFLQAVAGGVKEADISTDFASLRARNIADGARTTLELTFTLH
jgi:hypothetical protein